jgi:hypothetical protein
MSDRVYVFVDESGNHTRRDCYVVAGCWCASTYTDPTHVLQPTRNRLSDNVLYDGVGPSSGREIKGTRSSDRKLDSAMKYLRKVVEADKTIRTTSGPWSESQPLRFTTFDIYSALSEQIARRYLGEGRTHTTTQLIGLATVLTPIFRSGTGNSGPSEVRVVLDADTWKRACTTLNEMLAGIERIPPVEFEIRDSKSVPGIQLSDVAAYARRKRLLEGTCKAATQVIYSLRL